jgi:superfamily II DNA or RNA helicase
MAVAAHTLSLFDRVPLAARPRLVTEEPSGSASDPDGLRPYQREAVSRILAHLNGGTLDGKLVFPHRSTLIVMATGTGKTQTFGALAKHWPGRVLVLAHRDELIQQARSRLAQMTQEFVGVEQAEWKAQAERIVIGSVQSLCRASRLSRFQPDRFGLVIVDEAHHAVAATYRRILDHFGTAKVLGVTATPDRGDERAMEQVFDSVAFTYEIEDGIRDKWLCPVEVKAVRVGAIDLSSVKTTAGDLNQGQLDAVLSSEEALHGIAKPTIELAGDRRTILFTTSVDNAHRLAEVLNRYRPGAARAVDGTTSFETRRDILRGHKAGEYQFLCNVGVLTEGYDDPGVACVAMGRPTKSRALYAQCIGRGLRPAPGKSNCLVLDFVGNSGKHALVSALDILGGKWDDEVVARAKKDITDGDGEETDAALKRAKASIDAERAKAEEARKAAADRARIKAERVRYTAENVDPFRVLGMKDEGEDNNPQSITPGQVETLGKFKIEIPAGCTRAQATRLIGTAIMRRKAGLATYRQIKTLSRYGLDAKRMYMTTASRMIDAIAANGWRAVDQATVNQIIGSREPGEDG